MNASKKQELERDTNAPPTKMKINPYIVIAIVAVAAAIIGAIVLLTFFFNKSQNEKRELQAQLEETEKQLEVKNDAIVALEDRQREQQTMIEKLEELINVKVPDPVITSANINEQLNSVQELATKEYIYTNASRREANKTWLWGWDMPFSDTNLLVTYDGTIKAGINLSKIKPAVDEEKRTITILLPKSEILSHDLPTETIKVLEVKNNLFNEITFDNYNEFIAAEKKVMEQKAIDRGLLTDATNEAKTIIRESLNLLPGMDTYELIIK
jgi:hypothetical protein